MFAYMGALFIVVGSSFLAITAFFLFDLGRFLFNYNSGQGIGDQGYVIAGFAFMGLVLVSIGIWSLHKHVIYKNLEKELKAKGEHVLADFVKVKRGQIQVNNKWSQRVIARWGKHEFESDDVWLKKDYTVGQKILVYIDPANPARYFVQLGHEI